MRNAFAFESDVGKMKILPEIILHLNRSAEIDTVKEILEYTPDSIRLSLGKMNVAFFGSSLEICSLDCERLCISGNIISVSFST